MFYPLLNGLHAYVGESGRRELLARAQELQKQVNAAIAYSTSKDQNIAVSLRQQMNETLTILQRFDGMTDARPDDWQKWADVVVERLDYLANQVSVYGKKWRAEKEAPEIALRQRIAAQQKAVEEAQQRSIDGEARRQELEARSIRVGSVLREVLAKADAQKLQIVSSIKSRFDAAVSYLNVWKGDTGNPKWSGVADSVSATLEGVLKEAQALKDEIIDRPMASSSATTSQGTLVVDTTKPTPMAVAQARDRELARITAMKTTSSSIMTQAQAQNELAALAVKQRNETLKKVAIIGGAVILVGVAIWYWSSRE